MTLLEEIEALAKKYRALEPAPTTTIEPAPITTTTTAPAPTTTTTSTRPKLSWAPPAMTAPLTVSVPLTGDPAYNYRSRFPASGSYPVTQDLLIVMPSTLRKGSIHIHGGRNIVMMGGYMSANPLKDKGQDVGGMETIAVYIATDGAGIIHIEGLKVDSTCQGGQDAVNVNAPNAIVQIQNYYWEVAGQNDGPLNGGDGIHAEGYHAYWPTKQLRFDRGTVATNLNGMTLVGRAADVRNVNTKFKAQPWVDHSQNTCVQWFLGKTGGAEGRTSNYCRTDGIIKFTECYLEPQPGRTLLNSIIPTSSQSGCPSTGTTTERFFPGTKLNDGVTAGIIGSIKLGPPPGGDFCPAASVGNGYISPGYL